MKATINPSGYRPGVLLAAGLLALATGPSAAQTQSTTRIESGVWVSPGYYPGPSAIEQAQWEQWQLQREQARQQRELTRQQDEQIRQSQEPLGTRALREQAQQRGEPLPSRPGPSDYERAVREQQQLRREQWSQQRQGEESLGQRALREQAESRAQQGRAATGNSPIGAPPAALGSGQPARPQRPDGHQHRRY